MGGLGFCGCGKAGVGGREIDDFQGVGLWRHPFLRWGALGGKTGWGEDGNCVRGPVNYQN